MSKNGTDTSLVVVQLAGGNDYLNTIVPYENGHYYDNRKNVNIDQSAVLKLNDEVGLHPTMTAIKNLWDQGKVAIINGIGYPNPNRSHFRSMDIWHTAEPDKIGTEGWLGRVIGQMDPKKENVLTGVNFGRGLPRALGCKDVSVASVGDLASYGLFPDLEDEALRKYALDAFSKMYGGAEGRDAVSSMLGETGASVLKGADLLRSSVGKYSSDIEYASSGIAQSLKSAAQVMSADLGTRIYYTQQGSYDTHAGQLDVHANLWSDLSGAVGDFMDDVDSQGYADDTVMFLFTEFGRRIKDNGSGTDHGSGGVAFIIGNKVKGGMYGEYPSLKEEDQLEGDLFFNNDFRGTYSTLLEQWLGYEASPIVNGSFEQFNFIKN